MEPLDEPLREWLSQQRALGTLGLLSCQRAELLSTFVADWLASPSKEQQEWDVNLTRLLAYRRTHRWDWNILQGPGFYQSPNV